MISLKAIGKVDERTKVLLKKSNELMVDSAMLTKS